MTPATPGLSGRGADVALYTTDQAATELGVPAAAIRDWKTRGRVLPAGAIRGRGRSATAPLYRLEDLRPLAEKYLARAARHAHVER